MLMLDKSRLFNHIDRWVEGLASTGDFNEDTQGLTLAVWENLQEEYQALYPEEAKVLNVYEATVKEFIYEASREALN